MKTLRKPNCSRQAKLVASISSYKKSEYVFYVHQVDTNMTSNAGCVNSQVFLNTLYDDDEYDGDNMKIWG